MASRWTLNNDLRVFSRQVNIVLARLFSVSCLFVSLTMRDFSAVHDEICCNRHILRDRQRSVHRGGTPGLPNVDRSVTQGR